jgi:hypothetical protein
MGGVTKMSPEEQKKEEENIRTTATPASESDDTDQHQSANKRDGADAAAAVFFKSFSEKNRAPMPHDLMTILHNLGFRGKSNYAEITHAYQENPDYVREWIEALSEKRVVANKPAALLLTAIREDYPLPKPILQEEVYGPPDPDCDICLGTGTPLVDGHWQREKHCQCTKITK